MNNKIISMNNIIMTSFQRYNNENVEKCNCMGDYIIIKHHPIKGFFFIKTNLKKLIKLIKKDKKNRNKKLKYRTCNLELIQPFKKRKIYFDFDDVEQNIIDEFKLKILDILPDAKFSISGYNQNQHITINNYYFNSNLHMIESGFLDWLKTIKIELGFTQENFKKYKTETKKYNSRFHTWGVDLSVYPSKKVEKGVYNSLNSTKQMKMIYNTKNKKNKFQDIIEDENELNHIISYVSHNCKEIKWEFKEFFIDKNEQIKLVKIKKKDLNFRNLLKELPRSEEETYLYDPQIFNNNLDIGLYYKRLHKLLECFDNKIRYPRIVYKIIYKYFKHNGFLFETIYNYFENAFDELEHKPIDGKFRWKMIWDNIEIDDNFTKGDMGKLKSMLENIYSKFVSKWDEDFKQSLKIKFDVLMMGKYTNLSCIEDKTKDVIINASVLGGGKTYSVGLYCKKYKPKRILILSSKITLSYDLQGVFNKMGLDFQHYQDIRCDKEFENTPQSSINRSQKLGNCDRLVCSIHSLHYLEYSKPYDIVIGDEIKDLWNTFNSKTCMKHYEKYDKYDINYRTLCRHLRLTNRIFFMDALIPSKVKDWIKIIRPRSEIKTIKKTGGIPRSVYIFKKRSIEPIFKKMIEKIKQNKKIYVYYPYANDKGIYKLSINNFGRKLCKFSGISEDDMLVIQGSSDREIKKQMRNVNELWGKYKIILVNSATTIGVSYTKGDVDSVFLCWCNFIPVSDILQTSCRCRTLLSNEVYIWNMCGLDEIQKKDRNHNRWIPTLQNDGENNEIHFKSFNIIQRHLNIEHKGNTFHSLVYLFEKLGHTIIKDYEIEYDETFKESLKKWRQNDKISPFSYHNIDLIDKKTMKLHREKESENVIKQLEFWELRKYYIEKMFMKDTPIDVKELFYEKENLLRTMKLLTFNNWGDKKDDEQNILECVFEGFWDKENKCYKLRTDELNLTTQQKITTNNTILRKYIIKHFFGISDGIDCDGVLHEKIRVYLDSYSKYSKRCNSKYKNVEVFDCCMIDSDSEDEDEEEEEERYKCDLCNVIVSKENIIYYYKYKEDHYEGYLCRSCVKKKVEIEDGDKIIDI